MSQDVKIKGNRHEIVIPWARKSWDIAGDVRVPRMIVKVLGFWTLLLSR